VTVAADGSFVFDPRSDFADLDAGETETVVFAYTAATAGGGSDTATATITIAGEGGSRLITDFETGVLPGAERGDVAIVGAVRDGDFHAEPAHGASLLRLEADGPGGEAISAFIGQDTLNPLIDLIDNSLPVRGSAFRLEAALEAGDTVSFFWWFDSAESSGATGAALDDFALFRAGDDAHRFAGARMQTALTGVSEGHLEAYWTQWTVPDTAEYGLSWSVFDDAIDLRPSTLLIDLVEVNAPVPEGYTIVPEYSTDPFATFAPPASA
jgi:hypothetical protein